jgi:acyl-CoA thioester hydrolase
MEAMFVNSHTHQFRVRYSETDQMQTFYNSRALEWFEVGRTELSRAMGVSYAEWEHRGIRLPLIEAHVYFTGRAKYDDLLEMTTSIQREGRARIRFENRIVQADGSGNVAHGYTVHAMLGTDDVPVRAPDWVLELLNQEK